MGADAELTNPEGILTETEPIPEAGSLSDGPGDTGNVPLLRRSERTIKRPKNYDDYVRIRSMAGRC